MSGDRLAAHVRDTLTARLVDMYAATATDDWPWFEDVVTYDNAKLSHALILSGRWSGNEAAFEIGLDSLRWLCDVQTSPRGCFRPVGVHGFFRRGEDRAMFDQQPLEAHATVSACIEAYRATDDAHWLETARWAFEWFLGRNDLGLARVRCQHWRLPRRAAGGPHQREPGRRVDARHAAVAGRDDAAGSEPGDE